MEKTTTREAEVNICSLLSPIEQFGMLENNLKTTAARIMSAYNMTYGDSSDNLHFIFKFEEEFNPRRSHELNAGLWKYTFLVSAIYVALTHILSKWMENRKPMNLRLLLILWSASLTVFSIFGTVRVFPPFWKSLNTAGLYYTLCSDNFILGNRITSFWTVMFGYSKYLELIDTLFIVLRKQKLTFLHWYHHASVLIFAWLTYADEMAVSQWYCVMNYSIHSIMYGYFTLRAMRIPFVRSFASIITALQIAQMVVGAAVTWLAYRYYLSGKACSITQFSAIWGFIIYGSYFILFSNFYYKSYMRPKKGKIQ